MGKNSFIVFCFLLIGEGNTAAQTTVIKVKEGQKFTVESSAKSNSSADAMGQTMETNLDTKTTTIYEIVKVDNNEIKLQSVVSKMQLIASIMGQEASYDSEKKDNEGQLADLMSKEINKNKEISINGKGIITKQDKTESEEQVAIITGADLEQTTTDLFIPALIGRELKVGDSFMDTITVKKEKYESRDSGTYTITAIENGVASISYSGTQTLSTIMEQMGMEMATTGNSIVKSEIQVEVATGLVLAKTEAADVSTNINTSGMTIPATGKTTTTLKITRLN